MAPHSPDTLLVFGHKSANFRTYFKNKSVLETLKSAESIGTTHSAVVNTAPREVKSILVANVLFSLLFFRAILQI
jgi:hypothetical protein